MSGLKNTTKRLANASLGKGYKTNAERRAKKAAKRQAKLDEVYEDAQMPDEEAVRLVERRKAARRRGSRSRNVLTEQNETLG